MYINRHIHQHKITQQNLDPYAAYLQYMDIRQCGCLKPISSIRQWVSSSVNIFPELRIPYIDFFRLNILSNSWHILGSILHIFCQTSQISMFYIGLKKFSNEIQLVYSLFIFGGIL